MASNAGPTEQQKRRRRWVRAWLPWIAIPLLALPAIWPFLRAGLPLSADGTLHLLRLVALDHNMQQGMFYPRWMPELFLGYGYPLLNFYGPATYYAGEALHLLGLGHAYALMGVFILSIVTAGYGAYLMAADMFDEQDPGLRPWPGLAAAVAYMYAPYFLTNVYMRGALGEVGAQALIPWIFWSFRRLLRAPRPARYILPAALSLGGLAATHNITLLWIPLLLLAYIGVIWWREKSSNRLAWALTGGAAAMGVSAFFWLPLIGERGYLSSVAFDIAATYMGENAWTWANFLDLHIPFDYTLSIPFQLGLAQLILAVAGFALLRRRTAEWWFWAAVALLAMLGVSQLALPLWMNSEILLIAQFPWRLLSVISLPLALLAGGIVTRLQHGPRLALASVILLILIMINNRPLPGQIATLIADGRNLGVANVTQFEADTRAYGASSSSEFMPRWASDSVFSPLPPADPNEPTPAIRLDAASPFRIDALIDAPAATTLRFSNFYFPGWRATLNGTPVATRPDDARGLLAVDIPAGEQRLILSWAGTGLQRIADIISLLTLAGLVGLALFAGRKPSGRGLGRGALWAVVPGLLLLFGLTAFFKPPPTGADLQPPAASLENDALQLLGLRTALSRGRYLEVYPYWLVKETPPDLRVAWRLLGADGASYSVGGGRPYFKAVQAANWSPNTLVDDAYQLALPPGLAAGTYQLQVRLGMTDGAPEAEIPAVTVATVALPATSTATLQPALPVDARVGSSAILDGADVRRNGKLLDFSDSRPPVVKPGDRLEYRLYWRAENNGMEENYHAFLHLLDIDQKALFKGDQLPGPVLSPPLLWDAYTAQPDVYWFTVGKDAQPGLYWPNAGLYRFATQERLPVRDATGAALGDRLILPPVKVLNNQSASLNQTVKAAFDGLGALEGYSLALPAGGLQAGDVFTLTVQYNARPGETLAPDYTQFVHLYDPALGMAAQQDSQPRHGGNPTSSWVDGEVIVDEIPLQVSEEAAPGTYRLLFGLYDAQAGGARVPVYGADGQRLENDQVVLAELEVGRTVSAQ